MVRLVGEVVVADGDLAAKRRYLMDGLSRLVKADGWLWSVTRVLNQIPVCCSLLHSGLSDSQLTAWAESTQVTDPPLPEHDACYEIATAQQHATCTRQQMVPDHKWYANPTVRKYRLAVGIDDFIYSLFPLGEPGFVSAIGLYRHTDRPHFSERERQITHIILSEVEWLHSGGVPDAVGREVPQLSRRQRTVLVLLLDGRTRKEIARSLHISDHTAKDHMESIYKHFKVSSQVELMRRFAMGKGIREREVQQ